MDEKLAPIVRKSFSIARLAAFFACPTALLFGANKADALLLFNFTQQGANVSLKASGSLTGLPSVASSSIGTSPNAIQPSNGWLLLGKGLYTTYNLYTIAGPTSLGSGPMQALNLVSSSHNHISLQGISSRFSIDPDYVEGSAIAFSGTFANTTLANLGLSSPSGLLATYSIGSDTIKVYAGPVPAPAPLPWIGGAVAFGLSRRMRSRLRSGKAPAQR